MVFQPPATCSAILFRNSRTDFAHPERVTAIISQNGNAYEGGLSEGWNPIQKYWKDPSQANRDALRAFLKPETTFWQYTQSVSDTTAVSPRRLFAG